MTEKNSIGGSTGGNISVRTISNYKKTSIGGNTSRIQVEELPVYDASYI